MENEGSKEVGSSLAKTREPFKDQCNSVVRAAYKRTRYNKKRGFQEEYTVKERRCEEQIWFEPSLHPEIFVGKCGVESHNPVYKRLI